MKILFVCDEYPPGPHGGIGTAVQTLARQLVQMGHRVWVVGVYDYGYGGSDFETDQGVQVYRIRKSAETLGVTMRYTFYDKVMRKLLALSGRLTGETQSGVDQLFQLICQLHEEETLDIIEITDHQHYSSQVNAPVFLRLPDVPVVVRLHGGNTYLAIESGRTPNGIARQIEQTHFRNATAISSVSEYAARKTAAGLGWEGPITVIPNGVAVSKPYEAMHKQPHQVLFTGSLTSGKGIRELMQAWNQVYAAFPEARLEVYGKGATTDLKALLLPEVRKTVIFKGHQPREVVLKALEQAAIGVFPSFAETFGLAPVEAMSCGVATIFTQRTSGPEIIKDGVDGLLVEPSDPAAIATAILKLLQDQPFRESIARQGYQSVCARFSLLQVAEQHIQYYTAVIENDWHSHSKSVQ